MPTRVERQRHRALPEAESISTEIRGLFETIEPTQRARYTAIEKLVGNATVHYFPDLFTSQQQRYLTSPLMVVVTAGEHDIFEAEWIKPPRERDVFEIVPLGKKRYVDYRILLPEPTVNQLTGNAVKTVQQTKHGLARTFMEGRLPLYIITEGRNDAPVDERYLTPAYATLPNRIPWQRTPNHDQTTGKNYIVSSRADNSDVERASLLFAEAVVHEKIHGLQTDDLPLPIAETQARYFARKIMNHFGYVKRYDPFESAIDFYADLVKQYGPDTHKVLFGTAPKEVSDRLRPIIYQEFVDNMSWLFPNVEWKAYLFD